MRQIAAYWIIASLALAARADGIDPAERLKIATLTLGNELGPRFDREATRVYDLCRDRENGDGTKERQSSEERQVCLEKYVDARPLRVAVVHRAPDPTSAVVGFVYAVYRADGGSLDLALEFEPTGVPSRRVLGSGSGQLWNYGIQQPGVRAHGTWVQLIGPPSPEEGWVDVSEAEFRMDVASIERTVVSLPALPAVFPDGERRAIAAGECFIERIAQ